MAITRLQPETRLSGAVRHGRTLYLAGQVAEDTSLDMHGQTVDVLAQIDALLAEAGTDKRHLLSCQIFITDIARIGEMNRAWESWMAAGHLPARATVEAKLANPAWLVEITAIAAIPE